MGVHELPLLLRGEEGGEDAVLGARPALVLARCAALLGPAAGSGGEEAGEVMAAAPGRRAGASLFGQTYGRSDIAGRRNIVRFKVSFFCIFNFVQ